MSNTRKAKPAPPPEPARPVLISRGRYAIHESPEGDGIISYRPDGAEEDQHQVVPAKFWRVLLGVMRGEIADPGLMGIMKMLAGR